MKQKNEKMKKRADGEPQSDTKLIIVLISALVLAILIIAAIMMTSATLW